MLTFVFVVIGICIACVSVGSVLFLLALVGGMLIVSVMFIVKPFVWFFQFLSDIKLINSNVSYTRRSVVQNHKGNTFHFSSRLYSNPNLKAHFHEDLREGGNNTYNDFGKFTVEKDSKSQNQLLLEEVNFDSSQKSFSNKANCIESGTVDNFYPIVKPYSVYRYNPLHPERDRFRTTTYELDNPEMIRFIRKCDKYVKERDRLEEKENLINSNASNIATAKPRKTEEKAKQGEIARFKKCVRQHGYRDNEITKYSNTLVQQDFVQRFEKGKEILENVIFDKYRDYFLAAMHIYIDYGYITAQMISYGLDIPLKYAYLIVVYLFGEELPEKTSTIDNEMVLSIARELHYV